MKSLQAKREVRLFEVFSGIGSQYQALKNIAWEKQWTIKSVGIIEWFIPAIIAYQAIHYETKPHLETFNSDLVCLSNDSKKSVSDEWLKKYSYNSLLGYYLNQSRDVSHNLFDITKINVDDIPDNIDIFTYSFPCQDISNQGKQLGFDLNSNTRSSLLWKIDNILSSLHKAKRPLPKYLLLENVKAILNKNHKPNLDKWIQKLDQLGYSSKIYCLNANQFNSPQSRERVFILSILKTYANKINFVFQNLELFSNTKVAIKTILEPNIEFDSKWNKYQLLEKPLNKNNIKKYELKNYTNFQSENGIYDINYCGPTLTASGALSRIKLYFGKNKIREMSAIECFKYMGFDEQAYFRVKKTKLVNDTKMIYLCGNSISVQVLEAIFRTLEFDYE